MTTIEQEPVSSTVPTSLVPARIDRLNWSRFHTRLVIALGVAWILDGLEITIASNSTSIISSKAALNLSSASVSLSRSGTIYLLGEVAGALFFGRLSDKWGRRNLFMITLGVYLVGGALTALTFGHSHRLGLLADVTRFIAGMGIGGEYAAINSAIDELIPARYRGRVDIAVNGTYWGGALLASVLFLLVVKHLPASYSWRIAFLLGPALGLRGAVRPAQPAREPAVAAHARPGRGGRGSRGRDRTAGHRAAAERSTRSTSPRPWRSARPATSASWSWPRRCSRPTRDGRILGASLMITQSFLYNAIFFTYALVLTKVYGVPDSSTAYYFMFFAAGNLLGPLLIGHLFDTIGRKKMIAGTYFLSGALLAISAILFKAGALDAVTQTLCWCVIFFFASAGASAAYLTVSEIFPVEVRAKAIAVFFAIAQSFGAFGPWLYGKLIGNGTDHFALFSATCSGAGVMILGAVVEVFLGVDAEGRSLEDMALPLGVPRPAAVRPGWPTSPVRPRPPAARTVIDLRSEAPAPERSPRPAPEGSNSFNQDSSTTPGQDQRADHRRR